MKFVDNNVITLITDLACVSYEGLLEFWTFILYIFEIQLKLKLIVKLIGLVLYDIYKCCDMYYT